MMKLGVVVCLALLIAGCRARTEYGECIGVSDDPQPNLTYRLSKRNVFLGFVFFETAVVPGWVLLFRLKCPEGEKS